MAPGLHPAGGQVTERIAPTLASLRNFAWFWGDHFLGMDAAFAVVIAAISGVYLACVDASHSYAINTLKELYGTIATISVTLAVIMAITSFQMATMASFQRMRSSRHFHSLWKAYSQAAKFLALLAVVSLVCILISHAIIWTAPVAVFLALASVFRMMRGLMIIGVMFRELPEETRASQTMMPGGKSKID